MLHEYVKSLGLEFEQTHRGDCPYCSSRNTFTATLSPEGIVYNCYSASCGAKGVAKITMSAEGIRKALAKIKSKGTEPVVTNEIDPEGLFEVPEYCVKDSQDRRYMSLLKQYGLTEHGHNTYYDIKDHRACFPVIYRGRVVDMAGRALTGATPKWLRYGKSHHPYVYGRGTVAVLVEDAISASVIGDVEGLTGIALLGTKILREHLPTLKQYDRLVVALDPDARNLGLQMVKELRAVHDSVMFLNTKDDIKYRNTEDMQSLYALRK